MKLGLNVDFKEAMLNPRHPNRQHYMDKRNELYSVAYPEISQQ